MVIWGSEVLLHLARVLTCVLGIVLYGARASQEEVTGEMSIQLDLSLRQLQIQVQRPQRGWILEVFRGHLRKEVCLLPLLGGEQPTFGGSYLSYVCGVVLREVEGGHLVEGSHARSLYKDPLQFSDVQEPCGLAMYLVGFSQCHHPSAQNHWLLSLRAVGLDSQWHEAHLVPPDLLGTAFFLPHPLLPAGISHPPRYCHGDLESGFTRAQGQGGQSH